MASRGGTRPVGTDGSEYLHRQKISSKYAESTEAKKYVKFGIYMHFMVSALIIIQVLIHLSTVYFGFQSQYFPDVPKPQNWQFIWLTSLVPAVVGHVSLNRNRLSLLKFFYKGTVILGLGPILTTMLFNATDLLDYAQTKQTNSSFHDFPIIIIWYIFLFIVVQIHAFTIYFARSLVNSWSDASKKRK